MENSSETPQHSNIKLIYSYTEYRIKLVNDSITALNTKFGSIIAFSGAAIGFSINLPNHAFIIESSPQLVCYSCLILKMLICLLLIIAIYIATIGYSPKPGGAMTPPHLLMSEYYYDDGDDCRLVITKTWLETLAELESMRDTKAKSVGISILALGGAGILAATDVMLAAFLSML
jgi:hypothetical protein